ncbi:MAG: hypothetical protein IKU15_00355 [Clostridia bacterium]|nr:hypothetical protein [Clostridia bacterium]MBR4889753.1 hypothetical protein [Clostridia bacterium]
MSCNTSCNICNNIVISSSITLVGTDLVVDIPQPLFGAYSNGRRFCLVLAQPIDGTVPLGTPVSISIAGDATTLYPLVDCRGVQIVAAQLSTRGRVKYHLSVATTVDSAVFKIHDKLRCSPVAVLASVPAPATDGGGA